MFDKNIFDALYGIPINHEYQFIVLFYLHFQLLL